MPRVPALSVPRTRPFGGSRSLLPLLVCAFGLAACGKSQLKGPEAEVKAHNVKLDLPAVPAFDLPAASADGTHSVKELRVKGKKMLNTELSVKGYVTWVYDCPTAIRQPGWTDKQTADYIEQNPDKCERPKFYLGDTPDTPPERSLWVVEVPREPSKLERKRLSRDELKNRPPVPPHAQGDELIVRGEFRLSSPRSERNSDGLLVYKSLKNVTQNWESPDDSGAGAALPPPPAAR